MISDQRHSHQNHHCLIVEWKNSVLSGQASLGKAIFMSTTSNDDEGGNNDEADGHYDGDE